MIVEMIPSKDGQPTVIFQLYVNKNLTYTPLEVKIRQGYVEMTSMSSLENLEYVVNVLKEQLQNAKAKE